MKVVETPLTGLLLVESPVFRDDRGYFVEVFHQEKFRSLGLPTEFVQDNHSLSSKGVLRGLHFQREQPQGKLVRAVQGEIFDVAVDLRRASRTFGEWFGTTLQAGDGRQLWIPPGFAHGFYVLSDTADVSYKCTTLYHGPSDASLLWNDATLGIQWPIPNGDTPLLSAKDAAAPQLSAVAPL